MAQQTVTFTVTVKSSTPPPNPLVITPPGGQLPDETVGTGVNDKVADISGGQPPYDVQVTKGALPSGTNLNSTTNADGSETLTLEGTPDTPGNVSFDLTVTDAAGASATTG